MIQQTFINLAVKDLTKSKAFFQKLGFELDENFSDEKGAGIKLSESSYAMLLTEPFFQTFTPKSICDAHKATEVLTALQLGSRVEVDALMDKALQNGAIETIPAQDHGFMYGRSFTDIDGHIWELCFMQQN